MFAPSSLQEAFKGPLLSFFLSSRVLGISRLGSKLWWGVTGIWTLDLLLQSQECNHYATGSAPFYYPFCFRKSWPGKYFYSFHFISAVIDIQHILIVFLLPDPRLRPRRTCSCPPWLRPRPRRQRQQQQPRPPPRPPWPPPRRGWRRVRWGWAWCLRSRPGIIGLWNVL